MCLVSRFNIKLLNWSSFFVIGGYYILCYETDSPALDSVDGPSPPTQPGHNKKRHQLLYTLDPTSPAVKELHRGRPYKLVHYPLPCTSPELNGPAREAVCTLCERSFLTLKAFLLHLRGLHSRVLKLHSLCQRLAELKEEPDRFHKHQCNALCRVTPWMRLTRENAVIL